jgi:choline dehydrogenase-like flavoprotein
VVIVGSGITGGWAAKVLTEGGLKVCVLEAGAPPEETGEHRPERQAIQSKHPAYSPANAHCWVDDVDNPYTTPEGAPFDWLRGRVVGGRSMTWGRVTLRFSDFELKAASHDGFDVDWPVSYADLAPYYDTVERTLSVCGSKEALPQLPDGQFAPPKAMTPAERAFQERVEKRWPERRVIPNRGIPITRGAQGSLWPLHTSPGSTLAAAFATGRLTLTSKAIARQVLVDASGERATGILYVDQATKATSEIRARAVVLCASAIESTRLLLLSAKDGLANSSGLLGKYLMDHWLVKVAGIVPGAKPDVAIDEFGGPHSILLPRFVNLRDRKEDFIRGYQIWGGLQRPSPFDRKQGAPFLLVAMGEMLPYEDNQVTLDERVTDRWGVPVVRIRCVRRDNEAKMIAHQKETLRELAHEGGLEITQEFEATAPGFTIHEVGSARMGSDPRTSVLNPFQQCWDVPNLWVCDGSGFVSSGNQNSSLTMMALTVRSCTRLADLLARGEL